MKGYKTAILATALLAVSALSSAQGIQVEVNGSPVSFPYAQPQYINGRVLVPMRGIFEQLGANVSWDRQSQMVHASKSGSDVELRIGDRNAVVNGSNVSLDVPPMIIQGTTMVPIRFVSESLGAQVGWMEAEHLVSINTSDTGVVNTPPRRLRNVFISRGAVISATLNHAISTSRTTRGETFSASITNVEESDNFNLPAGSRIEGYISSIRPSRYGNRAMLTLVPDRVVLPNGRRLKMEGAVTNIDVPDLSHNGNSYYSDTNFMIPAGTSIEIHVSRPIER